MKHKKITRRKFLKQSTKAVIGAAASSFMLSGSVFSPKGKRPVVSLVKIKNDNIGAAVEEAIDLLGGISEVTKGKERIMLKPNLVAPASEVTTKPEVIKTLAQMMKKAGKEVSVGEGSATAPSFNVQGDEVFRTKKRDILDKMQQFVFDNLGYSELAQSLGISLVNLHSGEMAEVEVPSAFCFDKITLHRSLQDIDLLCSVPMMKTHVFAQVTLGMKNLIGLYPGTVYQSVRGLMHDLASEVEPSGTAVAIVDMVRANKLGLVVVDGSMAMEGEGPTNGTLVKMDLIIAGTNPLATDMVAANCMSFKPSDVPTFIWANKAGMKPTCLDDIELRGERPKNVGRKFVRPTIYAWKDIRNIWGAKVIKTC